MAKATKVLDITTEIHDMASPSDDLGVVAETTEITERASRLKQVVANRGGNRAVAKRAGMPVGTLNNYLAGRDMKASALVSLAKACGVSIEWLATGFDNPIGVGIATGPTMPFQPEEPPKLFQIVNMDLMAAALEGALRSAAENNLPPADFRTRAQLLCLLYDGAKAADKNTR